MSTDLRRPGNVDPSAASPQPSLDYYLIRSAPGGAPSPTGAEGILVEEFAFADDWSTVGLRGAGWTTDGWWDATSFSRLVRTGEDLRGRVVAAGRDLVEQVYRQLGGGDLPDERALRSLFGTADRSVSSPPLRLDLRGAADGWHESRVYRLLFAGDLSRDGVANLLVGWRMTVADDAGEPLARVVGTARLQVADDLFTWELRRVGPGAAWSVDLSANLAAPGGTDRIGPLVRALTATARQQGLIPVTVDRFS